MGPSRPRRLLVVGPLDQDLQLVLFRGDTVVENPLDGVLWSFRHLFGPTWSYRMRYRASWTRSPSHAVAVDSFRDPRSVDRERTLVTGNHSARTHSWGRELTKFLLMERWIQEDVIARLEIQVGSPDSSVKVALVALLRLLEASISFLDRLIELLEELVSVLSMTGLCLIALCRERGEGVFFFSEITLLLNFLVIRLEIYLLTSFC